MRCRPHQKIYCITWGSSSRDVPGDSSFALICCKQIKAYLTVDEAEITILDGNPSKS